MEAFNTYDFAADPRWLQYRAGIEIPAGYDTEAILRKYRAKWYQREVDPAFDATAATGPQRASSTSQSPAGPGPAEPRQTPANATEPEAAKSVPQPAPGNGQAGTSPASNSTRGWQDRLSQWSSRFLKQGSDRSQLILFVMHITLICLAVLSLQPIRPRLSRLAWTYFLQTSILCSGYKVYLKFGFPRLQPFIANMKDWLMRVGLTTDFQYMFYSFIFLVQQPLQLVLVPITILAVYHAFAYCAKHCSSNKLWRNYGARAHSFLAAHQREALFYNAAAEVGVGFILIVLLLTPRRAIMNTFAYWQWLRVRYGSPDSQAYQSMVWRALDEKLGMYVRQSPLRVPLGFAQRWFASGMSR